MKRYTIVYSRGTPFVRVGGQRVYMNEIDRTSGYPMVMCRKPFRVLGIEYGINDKLVVELL